MIIKRWWEYRFKGSNWMYKSHVFSLPAR